MPPAGWRTYPHIIMVRLGTWCTRTRPWPACLLSYAAVPAGTRCGPRPRRPEEEGEGGESLCQHMPCPPAISLCLTCLLQPATPTTLPTYTSCTASEPKKKKKKKKKKGAPAGAGDGGDILPLPPASPSSHYSLPVLTHSPPLINKWHRFAGGTPTAGEGEPPHARTVHAAPA